MCVCELLVFHVFGGAVSVVREVCPMPCHAEPRSNNSTLFNAQLLQHCRGSNFFNSTKLQLCLTVQARFERCARPCYSRRTRASC